MNKKIIGGILTVIIIVVIIIAIPGVEDQDLPQANISDEKIKIFATFFPYYEFAKNVAGDKAIVEQFVPTGVPAHDWDPQPGKIISLQDTDVFVYNGLGIEPYMDNIMSSDEFDHIVFVKASHDVRLLEIDEEEEEEEEEHGHAEHGYDPHIWLDPVLAIQQVNNIRDGLILADPENEEYYRHNAATYNIKLDGFDKSIRDRLSNCNLDTFVPFHNAFAYFAHQYDLNVFALGGLAPDAEATATEIIGFVNFVKENNIKVVFAEDLIDPRLAEVIADEAGAQVMILSTLEGLTPQEASINMSYLAKMDRNIITLEHALECQ